MLVYVSDRRWKNIVKLLKTSAFVHGRTEVSMTDLLPVYIVLSGSYTIFTFFFDFSVAFVVREENPLKIKDF